MSLEQTQQQTPDDESQARELSLRRARPPMEIPGYEVQRFLGAGAYGEVWVGIDRNTGRRVAIKFYAHRGGVDWALIAREVEKLVFLSADRYVVQLLEVGWDTDPPYYVMEFVERGSLEDWIKAEGKLPVAKAVELFREIATGLLHAHGKGVLHCDLKPANILLDEDRHPRLADFGQARLSHEQTPALGTLFYMAPEQADLKSVPDARWDVYALGAIFYCMLTGQPPHRHDASATELEQAQGLEQRLERYRHLLAAAPSPLGHRQTRGVDWQLADIIDRCLAVEPSQRFANVQGVINALDERDATRARRPLQVLGGIGPLLLLLVMLLFGWSGYDRALRNTEELARRRAIENNRFAAQLAAEKVSGEIAKYFNIVRDEADRSEFHRLMEPVTANQWLGKLNDPQTPGDSMQDSRDNFLADEPRLTLNRYLESRLASYRQSMRTDRGRPRFASMFVTDRFGTMLAAAHEDEVITQSIGRNWAHRAYFHGGPNELLPLTRPRSDIPHIDRTHLSPVFRSSTTKKLKVAISTPLFREADNGDDEFVGVLVMTVNHGDFEFFRANNADQRDQFAVLVDGRPGADSGAILLHPLLDQLAASGDEPPYEVRSCRVPPAVLRQDPNLDAGQLYEDPLGRLPIGREFARRWIAAAAPVELLTGENENGDQTGLIVLVQQNFDTVTAPVRELAKQLLLEGLTALGMVVLVAVAMWYFVSRFLVQSPARGAT